MRIDKYLAAAGASDIEEVRPFLWQFKLPGDIHPAGRATTTRDGLARIWHRGAQSGLQLSEKWSGSDPVEVAEGKKVPSYIARLSNLVEGEKIEKAARQVQRFTAPDAEVEAAAVSLLESHGWTAHGRSAGVLYMNDGNGSTPACRLAVSNGIASVWSFRGDVDLPAPWRPGNATRTGEKTMYVTARDLALETVVAAPARVERPPQERPAVDPGLVSLVQDACRLGSAVPADHRHLTKSGARLVGEDLRVAPSGSPLAGDVVVPLFRPSADRKSLEISGGQRLCSKTTMGTDKMLITGSKLAESMVPVPWSPMLRSGQMSLDRWAQSLDRSRPLVLCEGVATALAVHESGAGNPIACVSSGNLPAVAKYLAESGLAAQFPAVVVAADYDIAVRDGKAVSKGIPKAMEAAELLGAKVSLPAPGAPVGTDARDIYAAGPDAVRTYLESATSPAELRKRPDIAHFFSSQQQSRQGIER